MNPESLFPNPTFLTKFLHIDQTFAEEYRGLEGSLIPANIAIWRPNLLKAVRDGCRILIIDPVTHAFTYQGYQEKSTYPYYNSYLPR